MNFSSSSYSFCSFSFSSPVSWPRRMATMAAACSASKPYFSMRADLAVSGVRDARIVAMISSIMSMALSSPSRMWALAWAFLSSNLVRRTTTSWRKSTKTAIISLRVSVLGRPFTSATLLIEKLLCRAVYLKRVLSTTLALASFLSRNSMRIPLRLERSLMSEMPSIFLSRTISPMRDCISDLLTM